MPRFDYYVEFLPAHGPFTTASVVRLEQAGAQVVLDIREKGTTIDRVLPFARLPASVMYVDDMADRWDRVRHLSQLFRQSLAGTSFDFGYAWPAPGREIALASNRRGRDRVPIPSREVLYRRLRRTVSILAALILCSALALGAARRIDHPRLAFCGSTDEFSEFMPGLRLHALPLWNLGADIRSNFFKSLMYSPHGFGDTAFYYLASGGLHGLGLSISDRHLWLASAATNGLLIAAVVWLAIGVAGSPGMAYGATLLLALSPLYVFSSQTAFARLTFVPLVHVVALLLAALACRRPRWAPRAALAVTALFIELTDGFYFGPVLLVFLFLSRPGSLRERIAGTTRDRTWWWTAAAIVAGLAIDVGLGALAAAHDTTLTLFGYVRMRVGYGGVMSTLDLLKLWLQALQTYSPDRRPRGCHPCLARDVAIRVDRSSRRRARRMAGHRVGGRHPLLRQRHRTAHSRRRSADRVSAGATVISDRRVGVRPGIPLGRWPVRTSGRGRRLCRRHNSIDGTARHRTLRSQSGVPGDRSTLRISTSARS